MDITNLVKDGMPHHKALKLKNEAKAKGQCYEHPSFPGDEEEEEFYHVTEISVTEINRFQEDIGVTGKLQLDKEALNEFVGEGGILAAGSRAAAPMVASKDAAQFSQELSNLLANEDSGKYKIKKGTRPPATETGDPDPEEELTTRDIAISTTNDILKEIKEARGYWEILGMFVICFPVREVFILKHFLANNSPS